MRCERKRILEERNRSLEDLISIGVGLVDGIPETQEERGRGTRGVAMEDGQVFSDSDDEATGGTFFPRGGAGATLDL